MWIIAPEVVEQYGDLKKVETAIGTGPFILERYEPNSKSVLRNATRITTATASPMWTGWTGWSSRTNRQEGLAMYRTGQIDCGPETGWAVRQQDLESLEKTRPHLEYQDFHLRRR